MKRQITTGRDKGEANENLTKTEAETEREIET
jgi:hypothetical protein